jgi:uroporphyrinogen-III synthase
MRALQSAGFGVVHVPMIETESVVSLDTLQEMASGLRDGDWLIFASSAGVRHFLERISRAMLPQDLNVAAVGDHSAQSVRSFGLDVHFVPLRASSPGFISEFAPCASRDNPGRFFLPSGLEGRRDIAEALRAQGHEVKVIPVYRTKPAEGEAVEVALSIDYDAVVFSSPSGVRAYQRIRGAMPSRSVAIGPTTRASLEDAGATQILIAEDPSPAAIVHLLQGMGPEQ